ncbi:MAG: acyltransferase [Frankia sp.]|nr:acyltransferase [Frankia sp.]
MVFTRHIYVDVEAFIPALAILGDIGYAGVTFFFILSGYVLAWSTGGSADATFWWRRFARVYPLYFLAVWIWLALAWHFDMFGEFGSQVISIVPSLLLVQAWVPDQSIYFGWGGAVLWSLSCEAFFYLMFPVIYRMLAYRDTRGRLTVAAAVIVPTMLVAVPASFAGSRYDLAVYANPGIRIGEFVLGVALGLIAREGIRGSRRLRQSLLLVAIVPAAVAVLIGAEHGHRQGLIDTIMIPTFASLIFLAGTREADRGAIPVFGSWPVVYFGEISYAFYLVHPAALTIAVQLGWFDVLTAGEAALALLAGLALATVLAAFLHHTVEVPARRMLMRRQPEGRARGARRQRRTIPFVPWRAPAQASLQPMA